MIRKSGSRFSEKIMPYQDAGFAGGGVRQCKRPPRSLIGGVLGCRMRKIRIVLFAVIGLFAVGLLAAFVLVATPEPPIPPPKDVFGFAASKGAAEADLPPLQRYPARDGEALAYRLYESPSNRILIFIHGSSYH